MLRPWKGLTIGAMSVALPAFCGCASMTNGVASHSATPPASQTNMASVDQMERGFYVIDEGATVIDSRNLQAGQQIRLVTSVAPREERHEEVVNVTEYAGTIASIDENHIVLKDASLLTSRRVERGTPILHRVPYVSRMFRNVAVGRTAEPLPHGVTIPRSEIIVALQPETLVRERIGIDFENTSSGSTIRDEDKTLVITPQASQGSNSAGGPL